MCYYQSKNIQRKAHKGETNKIIYQHQTMILLFLMHRDEGSRANDIMLHESP